MIKFYLTLLYLLFFFHGFSQKEQDSIILPEDKTSVLDIRSLDGNLDQKYTGEEFNYDSKDGEAQNLIRRFLNWFFNLLLENFGIRMDPGILKILEYIIYALMGALAIYLLAKFLVGERLSSIFTQKAMPIIDIDLSEDHIESVDLDTLLKTALEQKDYRSAIRYQYLRVLKTLSQKSLIEWKYEKTNSDYQKEITAPGLRSLFREVSYLYDYIWYGEQDMDETKYKAAQTPFVALKNTLPQ